MRLAEAGLLSVTDTPHDRVKKGLRPEAGSQTPTTRQYMPLLCSTVQVSSEDDHGSLSKVASVSNVRVCIYRHEVRQGYNPCRLGASW